MVIVRTMRHLAQKLLFTNIADKLQLQRMLCSSGGSGDVYYYNALWEDVQKRAEGK